jgi:hypothetical protein
MHSPERTSSLVIAAERAAALRLAAAVPCDPRTAARWLAGGRVIPALSAALSAAAARLRIAPPPPPSATAARAA